MSKAPEYWRITKKGAADLGFKAGTIVPADELAPQVGAMHGRGLIEPAPAPEAEPVAAPVVVVVEPDAVVEPEQPAP